MGTMMEKEEKTREGQAGFRPNRSCVDQIIPGTVGKMRGERHTVSRCTEGLRHSMETWVMKKVVGNRD